MQYPVPDQTRVNDPLFDSAADWISPGFDDPEAGLFQGRWLMSPPANDGRKVVISDTDHYAPGGGDALWAWKSFLRGHNPILMDFGIIDVVNPLDPSLGVPSYETYEPARRAMGDTRALAQRVDLVDMVPRGDLSSTGYSLASPGHQYLVLQPSASADPFTVTIEAGTYAVEWFAVDARASTDGGDVRVDASTRTRFTPPFDGPAVLSLLRARS
jgi:hypothetical protein